MNLLREDLLGIHKDRMKIGASLADVDPMQIDRTVSCSKGWMDRSEEKIFAKQFISNRESLKRRVMHLWNNKIDLFLFFFFFLSTTNKTLSCMSEHILYHSKILFGCVFIKEKFKEQFWLNPVIHLIKVCFDSIGGLSQHISALKEMVVFPLLYPEIFERFKIQPPR